jgi:hypothetical protein
MSYIQLKLLQKNKIKKQIKEQFPIIKKIQFEAFEKGKIFVIVEYHDPYLILRPESATGESII